jgi:hypothetical protein
MHTLHFFLEVALEFDLFCVEGILYENGPCSTDLLAVVSGFVARLQLKCDGTWCRMEGEVKGKLANGVGSQYLSHYLGTWCIQHDYC